MGSRFPEAVPGRHIPLLVLCRCVSPSVRSLSVMAYFSGVIAARTVIQLSFSPPFCFWILVMYEKGKSRYKKPPADALRSRLCICQLTMYVYMICTNSIVNSIIVETYVLVKPCRRKFLREAVDRRSAMVQMQRKNSRKVPPIGGALRKPVRFCAGANTG